MPFVSVRVFGDINSDASIKMTETVCNILEEELDIPADRVYVTYQGIHDWGWNKRNF